MFTFASEGGVQLCFNGLARALEQRSHASPSPVASKWAVVHRWIAVNPAIQMAGVIRSYFENDFGVPAFLACNGADVGPFLSILKDEDDIVVKKLIFETLTVSNTSPELVRV